MCERSPHPDAWEVGGLMEKDKERSKRRVGAVATWSVQAGSQWGENWDMLAPCFEQMHLWDQACVCVCVWSDSITQLQPQRPASSLWWSNSECDARFCWLDATIRDLNLHSSPNRGVCCLEDKYNTPLVSQKNTQTLSTAIRNFLRHDLCNYVVQEGKWGSRENRSFQSDVFQSPVWKMKLLIFFRRAKGQDQLILSLCGHCKQKTWLIGTLCE